MNKGFNVFLLLFLAAFLCACGSGDAQGAASGSGDVQGAASGSSMELRTEISPEELESGHASFEIGENLIVDADITEKEAWEKEYAAYYVDVFSEVDGEEDLSGFQKSPTLSRHSAGEWQKALDRLEPGKFSGDGFSLTKGNEIIQEYKGRNGLTYSFRGDWGGMQDGLPFKSPFYCAFMELGAEGWSYNDRREWGDVMRNIPDCESHNDLAFLKDPDSMAARIQEFLEDMSGRRMNGEYRFIPVGSENRSRLEEMGIQAGTADYGVYSFYYDVDGLPFWNLYLPYRLGNGREIDPLCRWSAAGNGTVAGVSQHAQYVWVDSSGIQYVMFSNLRGPGKVCRKAAPVLSPNEVLKKVEDYYDRRVLADECVISGIRIGYAGYFYDDGGTVRPSVTPVWRVTVLRRDSDGIMNEFDFVYDANTGDCLEEEICTEE